LDRYEGVMVASTGGKLGWAILGCKSFRVPLCMALWRVNRDVHAYAQYFDLWLWPDSPTMYMFGSPQHTHSRTLTRCICLDPPKHIVYVWIPQQTHSRTLTRCVCLDLSLLPPCVQAIAWSPDGAMVAVGLGGKTGQGRSRRDGSFMLLNAADLSLLHEGQDSRDWVCEIKFSPDSTLMAMASQVSCPHAHTETRQCPL